jgi:ketosteroid isomerase-like protein
VTDRVARDVEVLRRFFRDNFASRERRDLWAEDGVFELRFAEGGPMILHGRDAIYARAQASFAKYSSFRFTDLQIIPTAEEGLYVVTCASESVARASGNPLREEYANLFRLRDGLVAHRVEYHNPLVRP